MLNTHVIMPRFLALLLLAIPLLLGACGRSDEEPEPVTTQLVLDPVQLLNDSTAILTWSRLNNPDFVQYRLLRQENPAETGVSVHWSPDREATSYRDSGLPYTDYVQYQVIGQLQSGQTIASNIVVLRRPQIKIVRALVFDVQYEADTRELFFFGKDGTIQKYDVSSGQTTHTIRVGQPIGYCAFATYQGVRELYVPCDNGRVLIYDAATLGQRDEIYTLGSPNAPEWLTDVVASNGKLFVSFTYYSFGAPLRVYDRATKTRIGNLGSLANSNMRLKKNPRPTAATATEFIGLGLSTFPTPQVAYRFSAVGTYVSQTNSPFAQRNYSLDGRLFEFSPAGDRYVSGAEGDIFSTSDLRYLSSLPRDRSMPASRTEFTCFGFDAATQTLHAGTKAKTFRVFSLPDYAPVRTLKTKRYPFKIFSDGAHGFITLSTESPVENYSPSSTAHPAKMLVEHLD